MDNNTRFLIVAFICLLGGGLIGGMAAENWYKEKAIKVGCAQYNSKTAQFEWLTGK